MATQSVKGQVTEINGPIVKAQGMDKAGMFDLVYVGKNELSGEIIRLEEDKATIQVYEENSMMGVGEDVISYQRPLSVLLGPGLLQNIYDGVQRPLKDLASQAGAFMLPGVKAPPLNNEKKWRFVPLLKKGDTVKPGTKIGYVDETSLIRHFIMIPPGTEESTIHTIQDEGDYNIIETIATLDNGVKLAMSHYWPVRKPRPFSAKLQISEPLVTGQRIIDMFYPIAKGGTAAIPGGFGTGKTMTQHALAKWSDASIIIYIGCGERGNEMTDVLNEFPELIDPKSGRPLMERTILIANTSNV